jgi:magnesium transporter
VLWPLRDALATLIRNDVPYVKAETKVFLNDTLDHCIRLIELVETQRDAMTGLIEMHLSLSQARTNDVISLLTIVSAIFIPLTFLVGVWGMNFDPETSPWNMPELRAYYGYPAALLFMVTVAVSLFVYFKWKKWL